MPEEGSAEEDERVVVVCVVVVCVVVVCVVVV